MPQAIPSYLIAFAIGDIEFKAMGKRTGIYAEHAYLDAAVTEFSDTEKMLEATEKAFGPYAWGRYDLLVLPPSFPFGGMENPRLSFITPTVLAGDKSLVGLIAHELAHSWTGNSVTNATWNDLWLNEGFTTYLTYRIMELVYGENRVAMERVLGYQSLTEALVSVEPKNQRLAVDLRGQDPDDSFSDIPYEKGALFLRDIELRIGREEFDRFLVTYIQDYKFKSLTTDQFLVYLEENLVKKYPDSLSMKHINDWVHKSGIPKSAPEPTSEVFNRIAKHSDRWLGGSMSLGELSSETWTVHEWLFFLNGLPEKLSLSKIHELDKTFSLTDSYNNEIVHSWLKISIRNNYRHAFVRLEEYLLSIGRRKLIVPLYVELLKTEAGRKVAERIYREARPGYHGLAQGTLDAAFKE
ncbi:MAG: leukotriene-A4 hydrolase [Flavobacteriales bacterium]|jgi:leukotriene-A4 hydrolase